MRTQNVPGWVHLLILGFLFVVAVLIVFAGAAGVAEAGPPSPRLVFEQNPPEERVTRYVLHIGRVSRFIEGTVLPNPDFEGYELQFAVPAPEEGAPEVLFTPELPDDWRAPVYFAAVACIDYGLCSDFSKQIESKITVPVLRFGARGLECGDCDGDGDIDGADLAALTRHVGKISVR